MTEHEAWLRLTLTPGLGPASLLALLQRFHEPQHILTQREAVLAEVVPRKVAAALQHTPVDLPAHLDWLQQAGNSLLTLADADYPPQLLEIPTPPPVLFVKGRRDLLAQPALAVVGSRHATTGGFDTAHSFARSLSQAGWTIVSGLADGIDRAAHLGGLEGQGSTIAVVGTGLDRVYPAGNRELAHRVAAHGVLLSEYALGAPPLAGHFPQRNRIIAGLARGCLVVEATLNSGSLITARHALEQGRDVFAIPGSIHAPQSKGCHRLIKEGAKLVECADDILQELPAHPAVTLAPSAAPADLAPPAANWPQGLEYDPIDLDQLSLRSGRSAAELLPLLLQLELEGQVETLPGGRYRRRG
ncbi:DNA-processing protein DprA [Leeia aquatica]|uniref:DNA-protecting protein DprA n=1 Tax=Leeia aquatica TaxID=2725557 RepID=A0A847SCJ9_9NEIS|nr:DNA-processing protein DprA [Leeia aquatica]NLR76577.1 DNA-protecting protein DprA [Leeia aquatica]